MEGERRKRKLEKEEENEEQKMEKFFALIKRTKDVRDGFYKESDRGSSIWNPKFQPEDFIDCGETRKSNIISGSSEKELTEKKQDLQKAMTTIRVEADNNEDKYKASEHLDLNLSL
ncbi:hypothetical protein VNO78_18260 [Psophocarpus tetragonolobus]|uniref:Uncharacterized protein n=1 Tax=Psophocarpus tetragonolobus TaxID=3891 RepID=A0AAN9XLW2_PSOTE